MGIGTDGASNNNNLGMIGEMGHQPCGKSWRSMPQLCRPIRYWKWYARGSEGPSLEKDGRSDSRP